MKPGISMMFAAGAALMLAGCGEPDSATPKGDVTPLPPDTSTGADAGLPNPDTTQPVPDWPPAPPRSNTPVETRDDRPPDAVSDMVPPTDEAPPEEVPDGVLIDESEPPPEEPM